MTATPKSHIYAARLVWNGNLGQGTSSYQNYGREYTVSIDGKADLTGSADTIFRGKGEFLNPEDLFIAAISSCHMLSYLASCAWRKIVVTSYEDSVEGTLEVHEGWRRIFTCHAAPGRNYYGHSAA